MKTAQVTADEMFLRAFDETINTVYHELSSLGVHEDAIWSAFCRATNAMAKLSIDVEQEESPQVLHRHRSNGSRRRHHAAIGN